MTPVKALELFFFFVRVTDDIFGGMLCLRNGGRTRLMDRSRQGNLSQVSVLAAKACPFREKWFSLSPLWQTLYNFSNLGQVSFSFLFFFFSLLCFCSFITRAPVRSLMFGVFISRAPVRSLMFGVF